METNYPTLRRPKRKLCYLTNKESASKQWTGKLTLGDIDKMFDDLDSSSQENGDLLPPSPLLQTIDTETNQGEKEASPVPQQGHLTGKLQRCQMGSEGDVPHPPTKSPSLKLDIDWDLPFKSHGPVKTSSPIEEDSVVEGAQELDNEKVVSPVLFACEDEAKEEAKTKHLPSQKPQCNGHATEEIDSELESPPSKVALSKPKMSSHENKVEGSCKESHPVNKNTSRKPQTAVLEDKGKTQRQEGTYPPVSAVRQEPEPTAPKKKSEGVHRQPSVEVSTRVGKDMTSFLQKLRDAGQPKPACSRKSLSPVRVSTPPEPEDDFMILEDDTPLWFSIPSKSATSRQRQRQNRTSSTDKDSPLETTQKQQEYEQKNDKLGNQTGNQKKKKLKEKEKNKESEPGHDMEELCSPEDLPSDDLMELEKPNKKKQRRLKKGPSKENDEAEEQPKDTAGRQKGEEKHTLEKKAQMSTDMKISKSSKDGNEKAKTSKTKSLKGGRKVTQGSDAVKEAVYVQAVKEQSHLSSLSDKVILNSEAQTAKDVTEEKNKQNKLQIVSEGSSSEDSPMLCKRKRRQVGQWWLSCPESREETKAADNQPKVKRSKQHKKEPSAAAPSPVKAKKERVLKRKNQTQPALPPSHTTNRAKEKKTKQNKNRNIRGVTPDRMKVTDAVDVKRIEEQEEQQVLDQDPDVLSSPLVLTHRDHCFNTGDQVFQRVYHHSSNEGLTITPVHASPRGPREQLRAADPGKRRRNPPSNWWMVDDVCKDMESISSQPRQQVAKSRKERKKQSRSPRLGTPKNGNMAVSSKALGGAPVHPLKVKPLSTPKTVKRSLATFKDIFTSAAETPTVVSSRGASQNNRRKVTACPTEKVTATDRSTLSKTVKGVLNVDAGEPNSPPNHEFPQDKCQSENTLKSLRSGPSSMIELEQYEDNEDLILPSSRVHAALSVSDLCAPPLKPLILQPKDKANMNEWFKSLWSTTVDSGPEITPDQFDWYFYQGRAIGFLVDLNSDSICNGKILLGSYMKKPLWVDHSATTVFNLLTSSVSVTIDGSKSHFSPGQSFMVSCGHAYSIQNVTSQPAVLYFTRILAESLD